MKTYFVVTGVVMYDDLFLILKKSSDDWNYPNDWSFCSGYVKEYEAAEDTCLREIKEETSLDAEIVKTGKIMEIIDKNVKGHLIKWVIGVYLCKVASKDVKLCHENQDFRWVRKEELKEFKFVPGLLESLKNINLV